MHVRDLLLQISRHGITLRCSRGGSEDRLNATPSSALTPKLIEELREHKTKVIQIMREDEELRRTGVIQFERQVFGLARERFGLHGREGDKDTVQQTYEGSR